VKPPAAMVSARFIRGILMDDDPPCLTEVQIKRLDRQFYDLFIAPSTDGSRKGYLVQKFAKILRPAIDPEEAAALVHYRFSKALEKNNAEIIGHIATNGLASIRKHRYFRNWVSWTKNTLLAEHYKLAEKDEDIFLFERGVDEYVYGDNTLDGTDEEFLPRVVKPLVEVGKVSERDAEIFLFRLTAYWKKPDNKNSGRPEEYRQPSFREIGEHHGLKESQVDRIIKKVLGLLETSEIQEMIQGSLDQDSPHLGHDETASFAAGQEPARKVLP